MNLLKQYREKRLVFKLKSGDLAAFDELLKKYHQPLFHFSLGYLKSREEAEELVQDVFVKIWEVRATLKEDLSFKSFVFTIAHHQIINRIKKKQLEKSYKHFIKQTTATATNETEESILFNDMLILSDRVLDQLPSKSKEIYIMSRHQGLTYQEIASQMNVSVKTVEYHMSKVLEQLRSALLNDSLISLLLMVATGSFYQ